MRRAGYDADTTTYKYIDHDGRPWEGAPGAQYGILKPGMYCTHKDDSRIPGVNTHLVEDNFTPWLLPTHSVATSKAASPDKESWTPKRLARSFTDSVVKPLKDAGTY